LPRFLLKSGVPSASQNIGNYSAAKLRARQDADKCAAWHVERAMP